MNRISCDEMEYLMSRRLDGDLEPQDRQRLEKHLEECEACRRVMETYERMNRGLREPLDPSMPEGMFQRFRGKMNDRAREKIIAPLAPIPGYHLMRTVNALAAVLVIGLGFGIFKLHGSLIEKKQEMSSLKKRFHDRVRELKGKNNTPAPTAVEVAGLSSPFVRDWKKGLNDRTAEFVEMVKSSGGFIQAVVEHDQGTDSLPSPQPSVAADLKDILFLDIRVLTSTEKPEILFDPKLTSRTDRDTTMQLQSSARPDTGLSLKIMGEKSPQRPPSANVGIDLKLTVRHSSANGGTRTLTGTLNEWFLLNEGRKIISQRLSVGDEEFEIIIITSRIKLRDRLKQKEKQTDA